MTDTVITPAGSENWSVSVLPTHDVVGHIDQKLTIFSIHANKGTVLDGVSMGPYNTINDAMDAIAAHTGGDCRKLNPK